VAIALCSSWLACAPFFGTKRIEKRACPTHESIDDDRPQVFSPEVTDFDHTRTPELYRAFQVLNVPVVANKISSAFRDDIVIVS
jgi:hypothetical protein